MTTKPLAVGDIVPSLELTLPDGTPAPINALADGHATLVYFMRTSACPVCHGHLRSIEKAAVADTQLAGRIVVIVPGDAKEAASVAARHPQLASRIVSSNTAHARVGLFSTVGMQRSGSLVMDAEHRVTHAHFGVMPTNSFDLKGATTALASAQG